MLVTTLSVETKKAIRYFNAFSKHFARKVKVEKTNDSSLVYFPTGTCRMQAQETRLSFTCEAQDEEALAAVKSIINDHLKRTGEMKDRELNWID